MPKHCARYLRLKKSLPESLKCSSRVYFFFDFGQYVNERSALVACNVMYFINTLTKSSSLTLLSSKLPLQS